MEESLALALKHGFHEQAARAYTNFAESAVLFKDFALAERLLAEGIAFDTQHDLDAWTHYLVGRQAQLRMEQGKLREAETIAAGVMGLDQLTLVMKLPALTVLARTRSRLGEPDAGALLERALSDALATGELQNIVPVRFGLIEQAWLDGGQARLEAQLKALAAIDPACFDPWEIGEFAVWWKRSAVPGAFPIAADRAAAPRAAELEGAAEKAADEWLRLGLPFEAGMSLMHAQDGEALGRAVALFDRIGAKPAADLARSRARGIGAEIYLPKPKRGPYAAARSHPLGLTQREIQVLDLITQGFGNQDIAKRLFRSPRTVEHHVSAVLGKLNAESRMDVVLRLRNEPWLLPGPAGAALS